jgi:hypothetical protein
LNLRMSWHFGAALFVGLSALGWNVHAQEGAISVRAGLELVSGDYGGSDSFDDVYVPVSIVYETRRVQLRLTVPYLRVETLVTTVPDGRNPDLAVVTREAEGGLGDVIAGVTICDVARSANGTFAVDLTGKVKFGTADEDKGLGTGENDYDLQADIYKYMGRGVLAGTVGRKFRGQPPGFDLDDVWFASAGGIFPVSETTRSGLFIDFRESSIAGSDAVRELSAFLSRRLDNRWRVLGYFLKGLSDSAPDWGGGISVSSDF